MYYVIIVIVIDDNLFCKIFKVDLLRPFLYERSFSPHYFDLLLSPINNVRQHYELWNWDNILLTFISKLFEQNGSPK